jgi:hypothetical protein
MPDHNNLGGSNRVLSLAHAAELLDMPPRRLRENWRSWGLPCYRVGRELRFTERDLRAWLKSRAVSS